MDRNAPIKNNVFCGRKNPSWRNAWQFSLKKSLVQLQYFKPLDCLPLTENVNHVQSMTSCLDTLLKTVRKISVWDFIADSKNFRSNRTSFIDGLVSFGNYKSERTKITCGSPPGSILNPLSFSYKTSMSVPPHCHSPLQSLVKSNDNNVDGAEFHSSECRKDKSLFLDLKGPNSVSITARKQRACKKPGSKISINIV